MTFRIDMQTVAGIQVKVTEFGRPVPSALYRRLVSTINPDNPLSLLAFRLTLLAHLPRTRKIVLPLGEDQSSTTQQTGLRRTIVSSIESGDKPGTISVEGGIPTIISPEEPLGELLTAEGAVAAFVEADTFASNPPIASTEPKTDIWPRAAFLLSDVINSLDTSPLE